jgi:citrate lyase subunit beta / citryl-CoA lyase
MMREFANDVATAQSWLFVPGDRPDRFLNAAHCGAHMVVVDLEDAVASSTKDTARKSMAFSIGTAAFDGQSVSVRINPTGSDEVQEDLHALGTAYDRAHHELAVLIPKADSAASLSALCTRLPSGMPVIPIIESASGLLYAFEIAQLTSVRRLAFGSIDFALDLDIADTVDNLRYARSHLVTVSRAAGLPAPIDGVTKDFSDATTAAVDARAARESGFQGKLCIHPRQVPAVNDAFNYTPEEIEWADAILSAAETNPSGSIAVDGAMVDAPVIARARRIVDRVTRSEGKDTKP